MFGSARSDCLRGVGRSFYRTRHARFPGLAGLRQQPGVTFASGSLCLSGACVTWNTLLSLRPRLRVKKTS